MHGLATIKELNKIKAEKIRKNEYAKKLSLTEKVIIIFRHIFFRWNV